MASYGVRDTNKTGSGRVVNPEDGKDAFHRVPFIPGEVRDAVERVLTIPEERLRGREPDEPIPPGPSPAVPGPVKIFALFSCIETEMSIKSTA